MAKWKTYYHIQGFYTHEIKAKTYKEAVRKSIAINEDLVKLIQKAEKEKIFQFQFDLYINFDEVEEVEFDYDEALLRGMYDDDDDGDDEI